VSGRERESATADAALRVRVERALRPVPDFPQPGILFQDITPLLADAPLFADVVAGMAEPWRAAGVTHVAGVESRGFILAAPIALALGAGFIPVRKPGKLPRRTVSQDYALEYGSGRLEIHEDACPRGSRVLVIDDVLATGGTASATCALMEGIGAVIAGCGFVLAIEALAGAASLGRHKWRALSIL
jgi:adenine phosphoribosyltransferase